MKWGRILACITVWSVVIGVGLVHLYPGVSSEQTLQRVDTITNQSVEHVPSDMLVDYWQRYIAQGINGGHSVQKEVDTLSHAIKQYEFDLKRKKVADLVVQAIDDRMNGAGRPVEKQHFRAGRLKKRHSDSNKKDGLVQDDLAAVLTQYG